MKMLVRSPVLLLGFILVASSFILALATDEEDEENKITRIPSPCEVCRVFAHEMDRKMKATFKKTTLDVSSKVFSPDTKKIDYSKSELRLLEVLDTVCEKVADYKVHTKEGMQRYAKQESETLDTLNNLKKRGVKVDIGMPWEIVEQQPNKEIMALKRKCEALAENYEDDLSAWYFQKQDEPFIEYFCRDIVLKNEDQACLSEEWVPTGLPYVDGKGIDKKTEEISPPLPKKDTKEEL